MPRLKPQGRFFEDVGNGIPLRQGPSTKSNPSTMCVQKMPNLRYHQLRKKRLSHTTQEPTQQPPFKNFAIVRLKKSVERKPMQDRQEEDNVRSAELDDMLNLETLIKKQPRIQSCFAVLYRRHYSTAKNKSPRNRSTMEE